jgi:PIN domain nuclease of toxin-antitoxin system
MPLRLLLDTHIFLCACGVPEKLPEATRRAIASAANAVTVSAVTAWEIAIKCAAGRLDFPLEQWEARIIELGVDTLAVKPAHGIEAGQLPRHHTDPFDRMLIAQARLEGLTLVTADRRIKRYDVATFGHA